MPVRVEMASVEVKAKVCMEMKNRLYIMNALIRGVYICKATSTHVRLKIRSEIRISALLCTLSFSGMCTVGVKVVPNIKFFL